jgi:pimeloyl-[acyl-carrier protein] synthase
MMPATQTPPAWPIPADDPYRALRRLREQGPVHRLEDWDAWLVVSHAEALAVLTGPGWSADPGRSPRAAERLGLTGPGGQLHRKAVLFTDPPEHTRLRNALGGYLAPRSVGAYRHRIAAIVDAAFRGREPGEPLRVMDDIAYPVPLAVICELLDAGTEMAGRLRQETPFMTAMLDPLATPEAMEAGAAAAIGIMFDLVPLAAERSARRGSDLLSALLGRGAAGAGLQADDAIVMALLLLVAGHETTANLIGNGVIVLHDHPDLTRNLRANPELVGPAVEEVLRFEAPVQLTARVAIDDLPVAGAMVRGGDQVFVAIGGANRDPAVFAGPDRIDVRRSHQRHLSFGHGAHFCAGAALARAESQEVIRRLLRLDPPLEDQELRVRRARSATFRRIDELELIPVSKRRNPA